MQIPKIIFLGIFAICFHQISSAGERSADESGDVNEFFDKMEKVVEKLMVESNSEDTEQSISNQSDSRQLRFLIPQAVADYEDDNENLYNHDSKLAYDANSYPSESNSRFNSPGVIDRKDIVDFTGVKPVYYCSIGFRCINIQEFQEFVFRPLYQCDQYNAFRRHCIFRRQLGTTLTLGVHLGDGMHQEKRINWYRCLRMKHFDNIIKLPLRKGFLPWNLNLGGSGNELRISPITEMDLKDNFFLAELASPQAYRRIHADKSTIHFDIESIEIDMGSLYPGEEIAVYTRAFVELPKTSVHFLWTLLEKGSFEDHGLPSNMKLNYDKSSVVIKELKTSQDQYLICRAYSNKNVLLARRSFLFRGFGQSGRNYVFSNKRQKRNTKYEERSSNKWQYEETENPPYMGQLFENGKVTDFIKMQKNINQEVPEIQKYLFYDSDRKEVNQFPYSDDLYVISSTENDMDKIMRRFIRQEKPGGKSNIKNFPMASEKPRFEDHESQMMATCQTNSDCNIHASCSQSSFNGQYFCKCSHGFNGNGLFCYNS